MAGVTFDNVTKQYPNGFTAVTDLDLEIEDGEFLVMVGPSGCGKSTTLRMIAGLEDITTGEIRIGERVVNEVHPKDRDIAMVFQNYALYPHMSVFDNIGFALKLAKRPKEEIQQLVEEAAELLDLVPQLDSKPAQLSGGQRQRVAMGRAIVRTPQVFLLDEPLSNLDAKLRVQMRAEITALQRKVGVTTFYVTHDQVEAMTMADRVAVINFGVLQQVDPPQVLFDSPDNMFVAAFIGSPSMNLMEAKLVEQNGDVGVQVAGEVLGTTDAVFERRAKLRDYVGKDVVLGLRPKDFRDTAVETDWPSNQRMRVEADNVELLGHERMIYFRVDAKRVIPDKVLVADEQIEALDSDSTEITARFGAESQIGIGDPVEVGVDIEHAHFFDPDGGEAIRGD